MESVGEKLRQQRVKQGLTLDDVSASTRISRKNLLAIEDDELSQISSAFFYRSFVRQFAQRLGLDFNELAEAVQSSAGRMPEPAMPGQLHAALPKVPPLESTKPKNFRWLFSFVALIAVLTGCSSLYGMWENSRYSLQASVSSFVNSLAGRWENRGTEAGPGREPARVVTAARASATLDSGFRLEIAAVERTSLSITADEKEIYNGVLEAAETKKLEGHGSARIRAGNAGGLSVLFNGKTIGSLGPRGQARTVVFTKDNYEIVEPAQIALAGFIPSGE